VVDLHARCSASPLPSPGAVHSGSLWELLRTHPRAVLSGFSAASAHTQLVIAIPGLNSQSRDPGLRNLEYRDPLSGFGLHVDRY